MTFIRSAIPSPTIHSINLGGFHLQFYSLFMLLGAAFLIYHTGYRFTKYGGNKEFAFTLAMWSLIPIIVFARAWHVLTHLEDYFGPGKNPAEIWAVWEGGLGFMGGLIAAVLMLLWLSKKHGVSVPSFLDAMAPGLLIAICFTRLGNYFNNEVFGLPTTLPWGLEINPEYYPKDLPPGLLFQPVFLYEILWNVLGFLLLVYVFDRYFNLVGGRLFAVYLLWYGAGRLWTEPLRYNLQPTLGNINYNYVGAVTMVILGILGLIWLRKLGPWKKPEQIELSA